MTPRKFQERPAEIQGRGDPDDVINALSYGREDARTREQRR
ncbi:MAG: hypothetical protein ACQET5_00780 [Halobacteriota archaeon]